MQDASFAFLARSKDRGSEQSYSGHIKGVDLGCKERLAPLASYMPTKTFEVLEAITLNASFWHDAGKLCPYSQAVLRGECPGRDMPIHTDAGIAALERDGRPGSEIAALVLASHHRLQDFSGEVSSLRITDEKLKPGVRCPQITDRRVRTLTQAQYTDEILLSLMDRHRRLLDFEPPPLNVDLTQVTSVLVRLALSILVSADHADAANPRFR